MKFARKALYAVFILLLISAGGIWYAKYQLTKSRPRSAPTIIQKESSPLDLRPAAIARLQQMVTEGSDGLYQLRLDSLHTDLASGSIILINASILVDSAGFHRLKGEKKLPDDVFHIMFARLRITGISLADLVHRKDITLRSISCSDPQISVWHHIQAYNAGKREAAKHRSIFDRLRGQISRLAIDSISIARGIVTDYSSGRMQVYKDVSFALQDILIDSAAEVDSTRFLFSKTFVLKAGSISMPAGNSQYDLSIGSVAIFGSARQVTIHDLRLTPHGGKEAFVRRQQHQGEVYDIAIPVLTLSGVDWWAAAHGDALKAVQVQLDHARFSIYVDQRPPPSGAIKRDNFPQQMLADLGIPLSLKKVTIRGGTLIYEEFTKASNRQSSITFSSINAEADGVTNIPEEISAQPVAHFHGSCRFMNATNMRADFALSLPRRKLGAFTADVSVGELSPEMLNPFSEAMGLVRITSGQFQPAHAHVTGNNNNVHGSVSIAYSNLHIEPLKPAEDNRSGLKKRALAGVVLNGLYVKNNNPANGEALREPGFTLNRSDQPNFFNFVWMGIKEGLLKTIGIPQRLGM